MDTWDLPDMYACSPRALGIHTVSGKPLVPMLQLLHKAKSSEKKGWLCMQIYSTRRLLIPL